MDIEIIKSYINSVIGHRPFELLSCNLETIDSVIGWRCNIKLDGSDVTFFIRRELIRDEIIKKIYYTYEILFF